MTWETDLERYDKEHLALQGSYYRESASRYVRAVGMATGKGPRDLTKKDLAAFFAGRGLAPASVKAVYAIVKAAARWLNGGETPPKFPRLKELARIKPSDTLRVKRASELLTGDEFEALCAALSPRDEAITRLIRATGCRPGEVLGLRRGDVAWQRDAGQEFCVLAIVDAKGGENRAPIVFDRRAADKIREYMTQVSGDTLFPAPRGGGTLLYKTYWGSLTRGAARAGIAKRVYGYLMRHMFASDEGARLPPSERDEQLGWKSDQYRRYTHLAVGKRLKTAALFEAGRPAPEPDEARELEERLEKEVAEREALGARLAELEEQLEAIDPSWVHRTALSQLADEEPAEGRREGEGEAADTAPRRPKKRAPRPTATPRLKPKPIGPGDGE